MQDLTTTRERKQGGAPAPVWTCPRSTCAHAENPSDTWMCEKCAHARPRKQIARPSVRRPAQQQQSPAAAPPCGLRSSDAQSATATGIGADIHAATTAGTESKLSEGVLAEITQLSVRFGDAFSTRAHPDGSRMLCCFLLTPSDPDFEFELPSARLPLRLPSNELNLPPRNGSVSVPAEPAILTQPPPLSLHPADTANSATSIGIAFTMDLPCAFPAKPARVRVHSMHAESDEIPFEVQTIIGRACDRYFERIVAQPRTSTSASSMPCARTPAVQSERKQVEPAASSTGGSGTSRVLRDFVRWLDVSLSQLIHIGLDKRHEARMALEAKALQQQQLHQQQKERELQQLKQQEEQQRELERRLQQPQQEQHLETVQLQLRQIDIAAAPPGVSELSARQSCTAPTELVLEPKSVSALASASSPASAPPALSHTTAQSDHNASEPSPQSSESADIGASAAVSMQSTATVRAAAECHASAESDNAGEERAGDGSGRPNNYEEHEECEGQGQPGQRDPHAHAAHAHSASPESWTSEEQLAFESALRQFPASLCPPLTKDERWELIASEMKRFGRDKRQCLARFKFVARSLSAAHQGGRGNKHEKPHQASTGSPERKAGAHAQLQADGTDEEADGHDNLESEPESDKKAPADSRDAKLPLNPQHKGVQLKLEGLRLTEISLVKTWLLRVQLHCARCQRNTDAEMSPMRLVELHCAHCQHSLAVKLRPELIHENNSTAGYLDVANATVRDYLPSDFIASCGGCWSETRVTLARSQRLTIVCHKCHKHLQLSVNDVTLTVLQKGGNDLSAPKRVGASATAGQRVSRQKPVRGGDGTAEVKAGSPLPSRGTCRHYSKSYRWFRFPCCGKVYACDVCHTLQEGHEPKWANRMICGLCSREQAFSQKACVHCGFEFNRLAQFWEGGSGCRDREKLSRKDPHKFTGLSKTQSKKQTRVGDPKLRKLTPKRS